MTRKSTNITIAIVAMAFLLGLFAGVSIGLQSGGGANSFQAGWEAAKQRLSTTGFYPAALGGMEVRGISGEVRQIKDNKIAVKIRPLEALADPKLDARIVSVTGDTKIYLQEQKDPQVFQEEMEAYQRSFQEQMQNAGSMASSAPVMPPEMFIRKEASLSDIKAGTQVMVTADADIKNAKAFDALEIIIQTPMIPAVNPTMPAAGTPAP